MADTPTRKEETHDRIVHTAARAIRQRGYSGVGVADVMKEAGLTHGGFYAHFSSKAALLTEATAHAGADGAHSLRQVVDAAPEGQGLAALMDAYLSQGHLDAPELGCLVAALGTEIPRQDPEVRAAATQRIRKLITLIEEQLPAGGGKTARHGQAMATLATLVGTLVLARAVDDAQLSLALRKAARLALPASPTAPSVR